jgi:MFS family permease
MKKFFGTTFSSLRIRNFRLYFFSQVISVSGTALQAFAQDWLVLQMTGSGTVLGEVTALQFLPILILTPWGGAIADRFPKKQVLYFTQAIAALLALVLGVLVLTDQIQIWMVFVCALSLGLVNAVDSPTRFAFVYEVVGKDEIKNAVGLWVMLLGATRILGPAIAGALIATVGIGLCFVVNALSYISVLWALFCMRIEKVTDEDVVPEARGHIRRTLAHVVSNSLLLHTLIIATIVGTITYEFQVSTPLFAKFVLHGGAATYSLLSIAMAVGLFVAGLVNTRRGAASLKTFVYSTALLGTAVVLTSVTSGMVYVVVGFACIGFFSADFFAKCLNLLQINTDPRMRGVIMSFLTMATLGSTVVGGPLVGWIGEYFGAQWALAAGGIAAIVAAGYGFVASRRKYATDPALTRPN